MPVILAAFVLQVWTDAVNLGIEVSEKTRFASFSVWISVAVILVLYQLLVPPLGGLGAALATLVSMAVRFGCTLSFSQRLWPVAWRWAPHARLLLYGTAAVSISLLVAPDGLVPQMAVATGLFIAYAAVAWIDIPGPELRALVRGWIASPRRVLGVFS